MRVTVVGYGVMGRNHERVLKAMGHDVTTLDASTEAGADTCMLTRALVDRTDVACIAVPIEELASSAAEWIKRGKYVLVEKPAAVTLEDLVALRDLAHHVGVHFAVGYTECHNPAVQALADHLHRAGRIQHIHVRRLGHARDRAGNPSLDLVTHDLDVLDMLGFRLDFKHAIHREHHVTALLDARHDVPFSIAGEPSVTIEASHLHPFKRREMEVVGDNGVLQLDYQNQTLGFVESPDHMRVALGVTKAEPLVREWEAFFKGEGSDGIAALTIAEQMTTRPALRMAA